MKRLLVLFFALLLLTNLFAQKTLSELLLHVPWNKTQQEINELYGENLKIIPKKSYGKVGFCESYLPAIFIGNYEMRVDFVINNSTQTLSRITLKPVLKLTDDNSSVVRDSINNALESMFGEPLAAKTDNSIKVYSAITKWLTDDYSIESVFMGHGDFQAAAIGIQPNKKQKTDFRKSKWGDSKAQVKSYETTAPVLEEDNMLMFAGKLSGIDVTIVYLFVNDQLVRAKYLFDAEHTNKNDYLIDYNTLRDLLITKYGEPGSSDVLWRNKLYQDSPEEYGTAISVGHLIYYCTWDLLNTEINMVLQGENFKISHQIEYLSKKLEKLEDNARNEKILNDL